MIRRYRLSAGPRLVKALLRGQVNMSQYNALCALKETGEVTMGTLAKRLHVTMGAMTNVVDKLVEEGYVDRVRSKTDRRIVNVNMTAKGGEILTESTESFVEYASEILARIDPAERDVFLKTYEHIVNVAEELAEQGTEASGAATDD